MKAAKSRGKYTFLRHSSSEGGLIYWGVNLPEVVLAFHHRPVALKQQHIHSGVDRIFKS